ncbi:MAG: type I-C CRISPR-associated protein Cas8c/Csd1 [Burkholderiaceae bacterium]|jgi:CRISPR-associated protein Csd1|nr:type I-C CRISPR-associated protein Cas8c/Csd1 [Burkholderiaceae bacterium]
MILQALNELYERKRSDPDPARRLPPFGFEEKQIPFVIEIDATGRLVQIKDTRETVGKRKVGRTFLVPQGVKKTSGVAANLLWDTAEYALGLDTNGKPTRVAEQHAAFMARLGELPEVARSDPGVQAVLAFLANVPRAALEKQTAWQEIGRDNPFISFQLHGDEELVCQRPAVTRNAVPTTDDDPTGVCLISGRTAPIERLHTAIKGVWGAQTSGANIVSFNLDAFTSFGLEQGANAPVGKPAAFAYTTALNHLLARDSSHRLQIGDASTVIWAQRPDELEDALPLLFGETRDDPTAGVEAAKKLYAAVQSGRLASADGDNRFYVLGLAPNAARIAVRFWYSGPLRELAPRVARHFEDLRLDRPPNAREILSLPAILRAVSRRKNDGTYDIPPLLAGDVVRAVFADERAPYPRELLNAAINRCRAEQDVPYPRAAALKAWLNRNIRFTQSTEKEFTPMLDTDHPSVPYRLGRLFAALEKIQEEAQPGINATIRERYYGAASSTPVSVFTTLLRLKNHHLAKLAGGRKTQFEKLLGEILAGVGDFPAHLTLPDQGRFALGYYHQRQSFFTKSTDKE